MMCALLKYSGAKWVFDDVITDVCDSHFLCPWNDNHHVDMDCIFNFFSFIYFVYLCRWLNCENPLINHNPWKAEEDKNLMSLVQEKGINNWFDIAGSLGTNRTPFQCLARYQRSLNPSILKSEWTKNEDAQLRTAIEVFGENDWQSVASALEGRTGNQCSNRLVSCLEKPYFLCYTFPVVEIAVGF
jgi:hypothetical protein